MTVVKRDKILDSKNVYQGNDGKYRIKPSAPESEKKAFKKYMDKVNAITKGK